MNCLVVDDNRSDRLILSKICGSFAFISSIEDTGNPIEALQLIRKKPVDLLVLDVEMPGLNGLDFLKIENSPLVILVSGKSDYAINAFDFDVLDYVLKPIVPERLQKSLEKARLLLENHHTETGAGGDSIFIRDKGSLLKIDTGTILYFQALGDYISIVTPAKKYTVRLTMKALESRLRPGDFIRVHRSYLVALNKVDSIEDNLISINNSLIPLGEMYRRNFLGKLNTV